MDINWDTILTNCIRPPGMLYISIAYMENTFNLLAYTHHGFGSRPMKRSGYPVLTKEVINCQLGIG